MRRRIPLLLALSIGCASRAPPPSAVPLAGCRVKTDLGFLDDPSVQKKVAAREGYRKHLQGLNERFNHAGLRLLAIAQVVMQTERLPTDACPSEAQVFTLAASPVTGEMIDVQRQGAAVVRRTEAAAFGTDGKGLDPDFRTLERAVERFERDVDVVAASLKRLLRCKGVGARVVHPLDGRVLFDTEGDENLGMPRLQTM